MTTALGAPSTAPKTRSPKRSTRETTAYTPSPRRGNQNAPVKPAKPIGYREPVVSVRGRRVNTEAQSNRPKVRFIMAILVFLGIGIAVTMYLSGITTSQSFQISTATAQSRQLDNEIETLTRDARRAQSSASIAKRAAEMGMVVADQPGVLQVGSDGKPIELRPAHSDKQLPFVDINNGDINRQRTTSDPKETQQVPGLVPQVPQLNAAPSQRGPALAPYSDRPSQSRAGHREGQVRFPVPAPASAAVPGAAANIAPPPAAPAPAPAPGAEAAAPAPAPAPAPVVPPVPPLN